MAKCSDSELSSQQLSCSVRINVEGSFHMRIHKGKTDVKTCYVTL